MGAHTVRASGCSWGGECGGESSVFWSDKRERGSEREGGPVGVMLCLLNSGEAAPSDVPLTCRTGPRDPGSKGEKRGGRG